ncbi:MAG TPA: DinB family protein [Paludibaculum sp.]|jgi:uncharacterized damage-inducible protein DinB
MSLAQSLLPEFIHELGNTRKTLARVPFEKASFQPHPKSMTMLALAGHLANVPSWANFTLRTPSLDLATVSPNEAPVSLDAMLAGFDAGASSALEALAAATDEDLHAPWTLSMGEKVFFTMPRIAVLRSMVFNHLIHHRGQLTVYLRMNDVPVPALYGPSADEA